MEQPQRPPTRDEIAAGSRRATGRRPFRPSQKPPLRPSVLPTRKRGPIRPLLSRYSAPPTGPVPVNGDEIVVYGLSDIYRLTPISLDPNPSEIRGPASPPFRPFGPSRFFPTPGPPPHDGRFFPLLV
ncbi:Hypothetical protein NTJ_02233 [Nesidiocoris tenuis]|uniref:Uncharacterized protein n=1 Tax=Nesidiocoris tenuis TaxID=355587 RepID=A0ABN7AAS9_9HEMI|nr:Hypothetical protein NTJ_02233 [Nesidiocoris tenuis]